MRRIPSGARRQRGWAGLVMLLLALVVVGFVVRTALKHMGLSEETTVGVVSGQPASAAQSPIERARGVQDQVLEQAVRVDQQLKAVDH